MELLQAVTDLSHEFGTADYIHGGGGNTSAKDTDTLWIKPSGTTLGNLTPESFVSVDRSKLGELYKVTPPTDPDAREAIIKDTMMAAVRPGQSARPSVETPLHDSLGETFVVHTHPALVNGMTCAKGGADTCRSLFPNALWIDYVDPGYMLCMRVREGIASYQQRHGRLPEAVFMENHGVLVAGQTPQAIRDTYAEIMDRLREQYRQSGISTELNETSAPTPETTKGLTKRLGELPAAKETTCVSSGGSFAVMPGPLSPDHILYAGPYPLVGEPTAEAFAAFRSAYGCAPRIIACEAGVFGLGPARKVAELAMEFARDGALIVQLAEAFGGVQYMSDRARDFIVNWEVEVYRAKQI